ncbi:type II toxin-antitoxin system YafO family toxin [Pectobacterium versatile]|uniref:type II toxin-antitoxin system YafO family toxin n=1 Tax=Pectobacterium versatile TaxID=2488639 RepID=UPI001F1F6688|nr:type II toxin-antitoxin system YafO family toxin [Pectobacterium versatile]
MITVTVHPDVEHPEVATEYALAMQNWKNGAARPAVFGSEGRWEENPRLMASGIHKIHIQLPGEPPWASHLPVIRRHSNNYLVYARHEWDETKYQIISIMAPNAHELARTSFLGELERRAEEFHAS